MKDNNSLVFPKQWELDYLQQSVFSKYAKVLSWIGRHLRCKICSFIAHRKNSISFLCPQLSTVYCCNYVYETEQIFAS